MKRIIRTYVELSLLYEAINMDLNTPLINKISKILTDIQNKTVTFYFRLYILNPNGYHIGYETYEVIGSITEKNIVELNKMQKHKYNEWLVETSQDFRIECISAPDTEYCDCKYDDDTNIECDCEGNCTCECECQCELYQSPLNNKDIDHEEAFETFESYFEDLTNTPITWSFANDKWKIV